MDTNSASLIADLFLDSYMADFIQAAFKKYEKKLARSFNFPFRCPIVVFPPSPSPPPVFDRRESGYIVEFLPGKMAI
jgi:hypothetical protein